MKNSHFLRIALIGWSALLIAGQSKADSFERLDIQPRPVPLERSAGVYVELAGDSNSVFLLHGGLPAVLNAQPVSDVWVFDGANWQFIDNSAPRVYGHTLVAGGVGEAYGFGGVDANDELRSLGTISSYSLSRGDSGLEVVIEEISVAGPNPGSCSESPVVRLDDRGSMLLIGGMCSYFPGWSAEVWEYRIDSNSWHRRADLPRPIADHSAVVTNGQVWVFGGTGNDGRLNDIYRYDPQSDSWSEVFPNGVRPEPLSDHRAVAIGDSMVVFGGTRAPFWPETIAEVWELDLTTLRWTRKKDLPYGLAEMAVGMVPSDLAEGDTAQVLLFGGVIDAWSFPLVLSDETWIYTSDITKTAELIAIPAVARVRGKGAFFTSTMYLMNKGDVDLDLELTLTPRMDMQGDPITVNYVIAPGIMETVDDPLNALFGFGGDDNMVGSLLIEVVGGSPDDLVMRTLISAAVDSGEEYGTYFPAIRSGDALTVSETGYLTTTENPSTYRVNAGLMALVDSTTVTMTPMTRLGDPIAGSVTFQINAGENTQINDVHRFFNIGSIADVMIEVAVDSGKAIAYATVLDGTKSYSGTSDPTTVLPISRGSDHITLLEIGSIQGIDEFSGSATIVNYSEHVAEVRADFCERGIPGVSSSRVFTIDPGKAVGSGDFVGEVFRIYGTVGTVILQSLNGARISATGREFAILRDQIDNEIVGTAGTHLPGLTDGDLVSPGRTWHVIGLRQKLDENEKERSHLAVFNPGSESSKITVSLFNGSDGLVEGSRSWVIEGRELIQINNVMKKINDEINGAEKRIEITVDRPVHLQVFRVNTWGDSVTLSAAGG